MDHLRHQNYKNADTEMEYLNNMQENRILKVKNRFLQIEKKIKELKGKELEVRKQIWKGNRRAIFQTN